MSPHWLSRSDGNAPLFVALSISPCVAPNAILQRHGALVRSKMFVLTRPATAITVNARASHACLRSYSSPLLTSTSVLFPPSRKYIFRGCNFRTLWLRSRPYNISLKREKRFMFVDNKKQIFVNRKVRWVWKWIFCFSRVLKLDCGWA